MIRLLERNGIALSVKYGVDISDIVKSMLQTSDGFFDFYIKLSSVCFQLKLGMWENGRLGLE